MNPLLGLHGVESALALGLLLPAMGAATGAHQVVVRRRRSLQYPTLTRVQEAFGSSLLLWSVPTCVLALNAFRFRQCSPWLGLTFMAMGPLLGIALAVFVGQAIALFGCRLGRAVLGLAALVPLLSIALELEQLYNSPGIFALDHFAGFAPGTIYDEGVQIPEAYLTFRATSMVLIAFVVLVTDVAIDPVSLSLRLHRVRAAPFRVLVLLLSAACLAACTKFGAELNHVSDAAYIAKTLGRTLDGARCIIHVPRETSSRDAERLLQDCEFRVWQAEARLGVSKREPVIAYFFRNKEEKRRLMGASRTYIAKPWRREIYLQQRPWPHPVLAHEVVHIVAGEFGRGPFRIAATLGGLLPKFGLIEGVAVAVAWDLREQLTPHEWSKAMLELGSLPDLDQVMGLRFGTLSARRSYSASGSFVRFLLDTEGAEVVRHAYRSGDLEAATGASIAELQNRWQVFLQSVPLSEDGKARVAAALSRRSIFGAICPHKIANLREQLRAEVAAGDAAEVQNTCEQILGFDESDLWARVTLVGALARLGDRDRVQRELKRLEDEPAISHMMAMERVGDAAWARSELGSALENYQTLLRASPPYSMMRRLVVKQEALNHGGRQAEIVYELLAEPRRVPAPVAIHLVRELAEIRSDGLAPYLEARQWRLVSRYDLALEATKDAQHRGLPHPSLTLENLKLRARSFFALGRYRLSADAWSEVREHGSSRAADHAEAKDWIERAKRALVHEREQKSSVR
ncbi:MAG: hypothetical protein AAF550_03795 [Myxococcota bacterium]